VCHHGCRHYRRVQDVATRAVDGCRRATATGIRVFIRHVCHIFIWLATVWFFTTRLVAAALGLIATLRFVITTALRVAVATLMIVIGALDDE
jgi:hypothetical protein